MLHMKIKIPQPCQVPWDDMSPREDRSRYCTHCQKCVTDFTQYTDQQIIDALRDPSQRTCGRFSQHQLERVLRPNNSKFPKRRNYIGFASLAALAAFNFVKQPIERTTSWRPLLSWEQAKKSQNAPIQAQTDSIPDTLIQIKGRVFEEKTKEALVGATILIKGTKTGTVTNIDGYYELAYNMLKHQQNIEIEVSYTGFESQIIRIQDFQNTDRTGAILISDVWLNPGALYGYGDIEVYDYLEPTRWQRFKRWLSHRD
jgi:CarboxypepD_reg-like domain